MTYSVCHKIACNYLLTSRLYGLCLVVIKPRPEAGKSFRAKGAAPLSGPGSAGSGDAARIGRNF